MKLRTGTILEMTRGHGRRATEIHLIVDEGDKPRRMRVDCDSHRTDSAHFAVGTELSYKRFRTDDPDKSNPKWVMCGIRHPSPTIERTTAAWLAWKHGGTVPHELVRDLADKMRIGTFQQEEHPKHEIMIENGCLQAMADLGPVYLQKDSVTVAGMPESVRMHLPGRLLRDVVDLPFLTDERIVSVEGEDTWTQITFDAREVPLLPYASSPEEPATALAA